MKNKKSILDKVPNSAILMSVVFVLFFKVIFYFLVKSGFLNISLGGGNDANYYNNYALGYINIALNIWPILLKHLNDLNFYSREIISYLFLFCNLFFIPYIVAKLAGLSFKKEQKNYLYITLICLVYPTLYFFTFDIYRDVFMVLVFLLGCLVVKKCVNGSNRLKSIFLFFIAIALGWFLAALRPYLGVAFIGSLFLWNINFTKKRLIILIFIYFLALFIVNYLGFFDSITEYRSGFESIEAGSTLGLNFSNPAMFIPNFILSFLGQMLGLYVTSPLALILLLIETIPFLCMLFYIIKNIKLADRFIRFLLVFFVLYASIWLIGNDNLGTAVRLRLYNYLSIYISFFYILRLKSNSLKNLKAIK